MSLPPPIVSNDPASFSWTVLAQRHPALIEQVRTALPYGPGVQRNLDELQENTAKGVIEPLPAGAQDQAQWQAWAEPYLEQSWFDVPFLIAENLFYRHLLEAVGYFAPGPWQGVDPFAPAKTKELQTVDVVTLTAAGDPDGRRTLLAAVWGNQADLGFRIQVEQSSAAGLVVDDSDVLWRTLDSASSTRIVLVADNAGGELTADLLLIDHLLAAGRAETVALHVKPGPYFVSDAMTSDVVACLRAIGSSPGAGAAVADRLTSAAAQGRWTIEADPFYCAPLTYRELPAALADDLARADLVILKGDLNYRRLVGDRHWDPLTEFADAVDYFPAPVVALRTLKSDVVVGLTKDELDALDSTGQPWRTSGTYALVQARL